MKNILRRHATAAAVFALLVGTAFAADASGTWKWTQTMGGRGGGATPTPREVTLTLTVKDGQVAGKVAMPGRGGGSMTETPISNASLKGDAIAFDVVREFNGNKFVTKYAGKVAGDTITGTIESAGRGGGAPTKREWAAKRSK